MRATLDSVKNSIRHVFDLLHIKNTRIDAQRHFVKYKVCTIDLQKPTEFTSEVHISRT